METDSAWVGSRGGFTSKGEVEAFLIVGATGELGGRIVRLLWADGHDVRCFVRAGSDDGALREVGATVVRGGRIYPRQMRSLVVADAGRSGRRRWRLRIGELVADTP